MVQRLRGDAGQGYGTAWALGIIFVVLLSVGIYLAASMRNVRVNEGEIGIRYTEGMFEGKHFDEVVAPGESTWVVNDVVYKLPARQITYLSSSSAYGADAPALEFSASGEPMTMALSTRFYLNTDDQVIRQFFDKLCRKYDCWDGALSGKGGQKDGWADMLNDVVGTPQRRVATQLGLGQVGEDLRYNTETQEAFADQFAERFARELRDEVGIADVFCGSPVTKENPECSPISVSLTGITFANPDRENVRALEILADEQVALAARQEAAAVAQQRVNQAKATQEYETLQRATAMLECAKRPECTLTFIVGGENIQATVPTN
jgi:hypothetical protein